MYMIALVIVMRMINEVCINVLVIKILGQLKFNNPTT